MFYVVSYDISDDRRRNEVHDTLKNYGTRVQFSVFECHLEPAQLRELQTRLRALVVSKEDNLRYYRLCRDCLEQTVVVGERPLTTDPDYWIA
jgi:CRISPR-associated protein Cas2